MKDGQVEDGIRQGLARVEADGVIIEGNSFLEYVDADLAVMCTRSEGGKVKPSARRALAKSGFLYLSAIDTDGFTARRQFEEFRAGLNIDLDLNHLPILTHEDLPTLISRIYQRENLAQGIMPLSMSDA
ncbi:MAG TPA: hypothetical protein VGQ39_02855 [Pyrinomonadaceae bacterium]|nr:hypothetical protein [Pyrinomonadaceae bacterium]